MKVGTDGVLLGAWVRTDGVKNILDIGTGTGLIALMLAQRSLAKVHAVEIDMEAVRQAEENFRHSPWGDRLKVFNKDFRDYEGMNTGYDLIVSNPPYFSNSLHAPDHTRSVARHDHQLNLNELMAGIVPLLNTDGRFGIIYPYQDLRRLERSAEQVGLYVLRRTDVIPAPGKDTKRVLLEMHKTKTNCSHDSLMLEEFGRHKYSEAFKSLTCDFYLKA